MIGATRYDAVEYPAALYLTTHPSNLSAIARLHGLATPDLRRARVLEIAGGDGVNLIAMAEGLPDAQFLSFDLSRRAVARGQALVDAAGLRNVTLQVADIIDMADALEGPFDFVIAHGLYAWVPPAVQQATLRLIDRVLSPTGIAFVSYNALPGGYLRMALRDMLLHEISDTDDPQDRLARAQSRIADFATPRDGDSPSLALMRKVAEPLKRRATGSLFHDELGDCYDPQSLTGFLAAAGEHNLAFLNDAIPAMLHDGLPGEALTDAAVIRQAQAGDHDALTFFHQTLLIRPGRAPLRTLDPALLAGIGATSHARRTGEMRFALEDDAFETQDPRIAAFLAAAISNTPDPISMQPFAESAADAETLIKLYQQEFLRLHAAPFAGTTEPGEFPTASAVARAQLALGHANLFTLDMRTVHFGEDGPRTFLALLDGTRDRAAIAAAWAATPYADQVTPEAALAQMARAGMILA